MAELFWNRRNLSCHGSKLQDLPLAIQTAIVNVTAYFDTYFKLPTFSKVQFFKGEKFNDLLAKHSGRNLITIDSGFSKSENLIYWVVVFWSDKFSPQFAIAGCSHGANAEDEELEALFQSLLYITKTKLPRPFLILSVCLNMASAAQKQNAFSLSWECHDLFCKLVSLLSISNASVHWINGDFNFLAHGLAAHALGAKHRLVTFWF